MPLNRRELFAKIRELEAELVAKETLRLDNFQLALREKSRAEKAETELEREKALTQGFVDRWGTERARAEKAEAALKEERQVTVTLRQSAQTLQARVAELEVMRVAVAEEVGWEVVDAVEAREREEC